ncbi:MULTISPECIES: DUF4136 domain-containing protein [Hymenobacter]|uniref:DUF4136 domain-containing protein n=2 Tax=Hymenobacter TaxID=89966 RepID=A0ABS6X380_9BACT|nr:MULTISPECIES: DUF4136 domain-containing protein [Hymenobacter]MBO3270256.1 DUF4136 domain-containing protein [Hymenobacter defluvii]MBW3129463.1 DUF4136 domain-containing protein [Hymenobacter profundi]QNE41112.1 DUF4136 domain-containing protein [Hymenobacter sp. NBH84]
MNRISRFLNRSATLALVGVALLLGASSCATSSRVGVSSDFDHAVNFRAYKTWAWYPQQPVDAEGGPAKGYESFLDQRLRTAIDRELTNKGLTRVENNPDIYVAYNAKVEEKQSASPYYNGLGYPYYGYGMYGGLYGRGYAPMSQYAAGTVIIDLVDAKRKELAWRGSGQAQIDNNHSISEQEVYRIVNGIMGVYPPSDQAQARR